MPESAWREKHKLRNGFWNCVPIRYCRECKGDDVSKTLTKHCVGRQLTEAEDMEIAAGRLKFENGEWRKT